MNPVTDNLPTLLVVEDEKNTREGLRRYFDGKFDIYLAPDVPTAMNVLETQPVDVLLTDLRLMGGTEGLDLLSRAQSIPHPPVAILMTAYGSEKVAVQAMKRGAYDYITKPLDLEKLEAVLTRALHSRRVETENRQLREELDKKFGLEKLIGNAPAMVEIYERIRQVAPDPRHRPDRGRKRHGQGTGGAVAAHAQPAQRRPVRGRPLRGALPPTPGKRTLRA